MLTTSLRDGGKKEAAESRRQSLGKERIPVAIALDSILIGKSCPGVLRTVPGFPGLSRYHLPNHLPSLHRTTSRYQTDIVMRGNSVGMESLASWCFWSNCKQVKLHSIAHFISLSSVSIDVALWLCDGGTVVPGRWICVPWRDKACWREKLSFGHDSRSPLPAKAPSDSAIALELRRSLHFTSSLACVLGLRYAGMLVQKQRGDLSRVGWLFNTFRSLTIPQM